MPKTYSSEISAGKITNDTTISERIVNTPSATAKAMLNYVQEMGTLFCKRSHLSARSKLDSYLIIIVLRGSGTISYEHNNIHIKAGDIAFIDCNKEYSHRCAENDPWELTWLHFNGPTAKATHSLFMKRNGSILVKPNDLSLYLSYFSKLYSVMSQKNRDYELIASSQINTIFTAILLEESRGNHNTTTTEKIHQLKEYLEKNFTTKISLERVSEDFFISKYYMLRQFKELFGMTIIQYLTFCRINHAKKLLRFTSMSVAGVANECGFEDASYFNKVFHDTEGITAGKYRKLWDN